MYKFIRKALVALMLLAAPISGTLAMGQLSNSSNALFPVQTATATSQTLGVIILGQTPSGNGNSYAVGSISVNGTALTTATFSVQGSSDGGVTYYALPINSVATPGTFATTATVTSPGIYQVNLSGITSIRIVTSGTFTATNVTFVVTASPNGVIARLGSGSSSSGVTSFNNRTGAVAPVSGDYTASQVTNAAAVNATNTFTQPQNLPAGNTNAQTPGQQAANVTSVLDHISHVCAEDYLYTDSAHSGQDYGVAINAAILSQQNAYPGVPVKLCVPGQHSVWTPIVDAWNVPLEFANSWLVPQSGGASGTWGATPITTSCTITAGSQNLTCSSIAGMADRMVIGGVGIPNGAYIQGTPSGTTVHIAIAPNLVFLGIPTASSNQFCGVSSLQGLATGQGIAGPVGSPIPASTTISAISLGGGSAAATQCITMSANATASASSPIGLTVSGSWTATVTAEAVAPVITVPYNISAYRQGANWGNYFEHLWIIDPGATVNETGVGRTLTGVQCFQIFGWDQITVDDLRCQAIDGAGLIVGGTMPLGSLTSTGSERESEFTKFRLYQDGDMPTGQPALEIMTGEEGCPSSCNSGADEDNTLFFSGHIVYPFAEGITIGTFNTSHTSTNGPRIIHIGDGTQVEDTGSVLPKASIAAPFDLIHCIQCGDVYINDSYVSTAGYGKSVIRMDTANLFNIVNSQFSAGSNPITYTVGVTHGSTAVTYISGGPGYFENQGLSDGIGGRMVDGTGSSCTSGAPCNVYLAPSGAVTSTTALNLSAAYFGVTGTSTLTVGYSGYWFNVVNSASTFNSQANYYVFPQAATASLLGMGGTANAFHVGGANFPFGVTDFSNGFVVENGNFEAVGTALFIGAVTGKSTSNLSSYSQSAGNQQAVSTKIAAYTAAQTDYLLLCNATSGAFSIKLPSGPLAGTVLIVKKIDSSINTCTVDGNSHTIDGASTVSLATQYQVERVQWDGTSWDAF